jgi:hypothetical protein
MREHVLEYVLQQTQGSSSIGRASVSKTEGWGFETSLPCHMKVSNRGVLPRFLFFLFYANRL